MLDDLISWHYPVIRSYVICVLEQIKRPTFFYFFGQQKPEGYKLAYYDNTNHPLPKEMSGVKAIQVVSTAI